MAYHVKIVVDIPVSKLSQKGTTALRKSRLKLKQLIAQDVNKKAPIKTGTMRNSALRWAAMDNEFIIWDTPYAHFQHEGRVMIGEHSHSPWARRHEKKVYTSRLLTYRRGGAKFWEKTYQARKTAWMDAMARFFKEEFK